MAKFEVIMPKMGESVQEATIVKWFKNVNDDVEEEDAIVEIATDKVDTEIPSPVDGKIAELLYEEGDVVAVGEPIALIATEGEGEEEEGDSDSLSEEEKNDTEKQEEKESKKNDSKDSDKKGTSKDSEETKDLKPDDNRFYSPLVRSIAKKEDVSADELAKIEGSGQNGRVTKNDILAYLKDREDKESKSTSQKESQTKTETAAAPQVKRPKVSPFEGDDVIPMDRMRKKIAEHMVMSKTVSPHVTSVIEADVTNMVLWRKKAKNTYQERENEKLTFMPMIVEAVVKTLKEYPGVNAATDGENIILRKRYNIGIAVALDNGNLIVPVIKKADQLNVLGITKELNRLANNARNNKLVPEEISGGTFSITNFGSFGNLIGTPIINQPEAAILAVGTIEKKPVVVETPAGDTFAVRHKMYLSLSYDHRIVDGALGGAFLKRLAEILESFDVNRSV